MEYDSTADTLKHIKTVDTLIASVIRALMERADNHDYSKLYPPEKEIFDEYTPKLKGVTYGSAEYKTYLKQMQVALDHHYSKNKHHPEHYENWIHEMDLIDIIEMVCDWKAATMRHNDGDIIKSVNINKDRFGISDQLFDIIMNTIHHFRW